MFHEELLFNVLVVSIFSFDDSVLLTMPSPTARDDLYSALSYCLSFPFSQPSLLLFVILCSSGELAHVTSALSDVTELLSSVSSLELRLQLSQRTCETYNLLPLTVGLLLTMQPREWNPNEELWNACTLKELGNQRSQRVFPLSEKIYYLFSIFPLCVLCWRRIFSYRSSCRRVSSFLPCRVYLSFPPSLPQSLLVNFLSSTFTSLFLLLSNFSMLPSCEVDSSV